MKAKSTPWLKQHSIKNECTFRVSFILFLISFLICSQPPGFDQGETLVFVILLSDCLQYSNSAINPVLYAFLSDNFKKSFRKACHCDKREGTGGLGHIQDCSATTRYNFSSYLNFKSHFLRLLPSLLIFLKNLCRRSRRGPRFTAVPAQESNDEDKEGGDLSTGITFTSRSSKYNCSTRSVIRHNIVWI